MIREVSIPSTVLDEDEGTYVQSDSFLLVDVPQLSIIVERPQAFSSLAFDLLVAKDAESEFVDSGISFTVGANLATTHLVLPTQTENEAIRSFQVGKLVMTDPGNASAFDDTDAAPETTGYAVADALSGVTTITVTVGAE